MTRPPNVPRVPREPAHPQEVRDAAVRRYLDGEDIKRIASDLDIPPSNINYWLRRAGHEPNRKVVRTTPVPPYDQLVDRYFSLERRLEELKEELVRSSEAALADAIALMRDELAASRTQILTEVKKLLARRPRQR